MPGHRYRFRLIVAALLLIAAPGTAPADVTQQCTVQGSYPSPVDENGDPIGSLLRVNVASRVGFVLDDVPQADRANIAAWLIGQSDEFWRTRARKQIELAQYRLNYRNYYVAGQGALPLTHPSLWKITFSGAARRASYVSGKKPSAVDAVFREFTLETVLVSDINSPSLSTGHRLDKSGRYGDRENFTAARSSLAVSAHGTRVLQRIRVSSEDRRPGQRSMAVLRRHVYREQRTSLEQGRVCLRL